MSLIKSFKVFNFYLKDGLKELNNNLGLYLFYILLMSVANAVPTLLASYYENSSLIIQLFAKVVFSIIPLLVLSKIIYVVKIRNLGTGEYSTTFFAYLAYSILFLLMIFILGIVSALPFYLIKEMNYPEWLIAFFVVGNLALLYCSIYFSFTPIVAAIEKENSSENFFKRSKQLTERNVSLILILQVFYLIFYLPSVATMAYKNSPYIYGITIAFSVIDAVATIVLTLAAVRIYFYLSNLE